MSIDLPEFRIVPRTRGVLAHTDVYLNGNKLHGVVGVRVEPNSGGNPLVTLEILASKVDIEEARKD